MITRCLNQLSCLDRLLCCWKPPPPPQPITKPETPKQHKSRLLVNISSCQQRLTILSKRLHQSGLTLDPKTLDQLTTDDQNQPIIARDLIDIYHELEQRLRRMQSELSQI